MELERDVERYLCRRVEELGGLCIKVGQNGWPDRLCILPHGQTVWVELKRQIGILSDLQVVRAVELGKLGQSVISIYSKAEVDELLGEMTDEG